MAGSDYLKQIQKPPSLPIQENDKLESIFSDQKFRPFLNSLIDDGILTLQQFNDYFQKTSIIKYLNKNNLYNWKVRLQIIEELMPLVETYKKDPNATAIQIPLKSIKSQDREYVVNFNKREDHSFQYPTHAIIGGKDYRLNNWRHLLLSVCELLIQLYPDKMFSLTYTPLFPNSIRIYFQENKFVTLASSQLSNGTWVDTNQSATEIINTVKGLFIYCNYPLEEVSVFYVKSSSNLNRKKQKIKSKSNKRPKVIYAGEGIKANSLIADPSHNYHSFESQIEKFLISQGLKSTSLDEIISNINNSNQSKSNTKKIIDTNSRIVEIAKGKFIHRNSIVDLDEAARIIIKILDTQFTLFDGYSNINLLHDASRIDLSMFMNDNAFVGETEIYFLAKHLFSKENFSGRQFVFYANTHIWEREPDYEKSAKGLLVNLARNNCGFITEHECDTFFDKIKYGKDMYLQGKLTNDHTFLNYGRGEYLLSESLHIDKAWKDKFKFALDQLFSDQSYIIPRDIDDAWFLMLPALPRGLRWTLLLFQDILIFNDFIYKPIFGKRDKNTIASAIVHPKSGLDSFADVVFTHLKKNIELRKKMEREELRLLLCDFGMIEGNELKYTLHKVLNERHFAWSNENRTVFIVDGQ